METQSGFLTPNNVTQSSASRRVRPSPLPTLNMSDPTEMWESMITTDPIYARDSNLLTKHPNITPRMRSILLDWLSEVSELYKLHRETFYLALDFVDRYLSKKSDIPRQQLQLIGTTCLFIAAKIEEVYPPKINDFASVTDGACTDSEIMVKELVIMETLKWSLHPVTVNKWLSIFMQIYSILEKENNRDPESRSTGEKFLMANYSATFFVQVAHLIDLCMLDIGSLQYDYDVIAASALYHFTNAQTVYSCSSFSYPDIRDCVIWMTPFALAVQETGILGPKEPANATNSTWSNMQYHTVDLTLLERAHMKQIDLTEDSSDESAPSTPPSPVSSSPFMGQSKTGPTKRKPNESSRDSPITITSSPIASSSNAIIPPSPLPSSSSGLGSTASSPNPLSTTSSPPPPPPPPVQHQHASQSSALTPSSIFNKPQQQVQQVHQQSKGTSNKRKRDLNNNTHHDDDDDYYEEEEEKKGKVEGRDGDEDVDSGVDKAETKNERRQSLRRATKKRRSYAGPTSSPATY